ncbi:MAG: type IX secretion system membrane protein PorP/SprF [Bacteroidetes bacterium]|nr:type IX secretion system membrane protein PorP/SprF [Bacteroidota bacterium]MBS1974432.1 type IX secretion system membrane protein PorP/SprF [Bacteroidota bacterium]
MRRVCLILTLVFVTARTFAQEINFSRVQDMTIWYNQSLKTDKMNSLKLDYRNVQYAGAIAYNSVSAMFDMPLLSKAAKEKRNSGYFSISAGAASDKSNQGILNNTLGLLGISYAVPIARNETYLSGGFQAAYYQSRLNLNGVSNPFGDQYDNYGPIENGISDDPLSNGWSYNHYNINAGISVFNNSRHNKWYVGLSGLQVNKPQIGKLKSDSLRLKMGIGIQGGYKFVTSADDEVSFCMIMNWQGPAYRHYYNLSYVKYLQSVQGGAAVGFGLGYRYDDALVPNIELRYQKLIFALLYDINISSINAAGLRRNGLEMALRIDF